MVSVPSYGKLGTFWEERSGGSGGGGGGGEKRRSSRKGSHDRLSSGYLVFIMHLSFCSLRKIV